MPLPEINPPAISPAKAVAKPPTKNSMVYPPVVYSALGDAGGSGMYRVLWPLITGDALGYLQTKLPNDHKFFPIPYLKAMKPNAMVFHRSHTKGQIKYLQECREKLDTNIIYTVDDWVDKIPDYSPHHAAMYAELKKDVRRAISRCDRLIVTNDLLANVYGNKKDTYIIPNYLPYSQWSAIYAKPPELIRSHRPRIGWSGAIGHSKDLSILKEIADILGDSVQWVFLGDLPPGFGWDNAEVHKAVLPKDYASKLFSLNLDLALAPLVDNDFNKAKSNLRLLEYAACGYPFLASNVKPYLDTEGIECLPYKASIWAEAIKSKLNNLDKLAEEGRANQKWLWENYKLEDHIDLYAKVAIADKIAAGMSIFVPEIIDVSNLDPVVDVLIPSYNNYKSLKQCIDSILAAKDANKIPHEIIILDHGCTDKALAAYLEELKLSGKVTVEYLKEDRGYIHTINYGINLHPNRDIITLNNDTYVSSNWVDRLKENAYSNQAIASVTPMGNSASILSYPSTAGLPFEPSLSEYYDSIAKEINFPFRPIPTPVGFCTYYKRLALSTVGLFDEDAFGLGYGEENDWAMRSAKYGWIHALAANLYVGHESSATFKESRMPLLQNANDVLATRWPVYGQVIEKWNQTDPLKSVRSAFDIVSIKKTVTGPRTLYIIHGLGGGVETYLQEQIKQNPGNCLIFRCEKARANTITIECPPDTYYNLPLLDTKLGDLKFLSAFLKDANVTKISIQSVVGFDYNIPIWVMNLSKAAKIPYEVMLHDYYYFCPRFKCVTNMYEYCNEPIVTDCNTCVMENGSAIGQVNVQKWREMYDEFLSNAEKLVAPSKYVISRYQQHFPGLKIDYVPHEPVITTDFKSPKTIAENEDLNVAVIGILTNEKGSLIVEACSKYCVENKLPIKFTVIGTLITQIFGSLQQVQPNEKLEIKGTYKEEDLFSKLNSAKCHISFFPGLWPESYSYTLSSAFKADLMPVATDIGAIAERIRERNFGELIPWEERHNIKYIVDKLLLIRTNLVGTTESVSMTELIPSLHKLHIVK